LKQLYENKQCLSHQDGVIALCVGFWSNQNLVKA
jgi:hypothetical protein